MSPTLAFILFIATIPIMGLLVYAFCFVLADGIVSTMDKKTTTETERITKDVVNKVKNKFK